MSLCLIGQSSQNESKETGPVQSSLARELLNTQMITLLVVIACNTTSSQQLRTASIQMLKAYFGVSDAIEDPLLGVLVMCLKYNDNDICKIALEQLVTVAKDNQKARMIAIAGGVDALLPLLNSPQLGALAVEVAMLLLCTEDSVIDFIDSAGGEVVAKLLSSSENKNRLDGLRLASSLIQKKPRAKDKLSEGVILDSYCIKTPTKVRAVRYTPPEEKENKSSQSSDFKMSISFWLYLNGVPNGGGIPIFSKQKSRSTFVFNKRFPSFCARNLSVTQGKVYYECTLHSGGVMQIGWASSDFAPAGAGSGVGDDKVSYAVDLTRNKCWWGGSTQDYATNVKWSSGSVIGCLLDFTKREMSFSMNGEILATGFTEAQHGPKEGGPSWNEGLFPGFSLDHGQSLSCNFGEEPLKFLPNGYMSVIEAVSAIKGEEMLTPDMETYDKEKKEWSRELSDFYPPNASNSDSKNDSLYCTLSSNLTIQFSAPCFDSNARGEQLFQRLEISSHSSLQMQNWTHIAAVIQNNVIDLYVNGAHNGRVISSSNVVSNRWPFVFGEVPDGFRFQKDPNVLLWVEDVKVSSVVCTIEKIVELYNTTVPQHIATVESMAKAIGPVLPSVMTLLTTDDAALDLQFAVLDLVANMWVNRDSMLGVIDKMGERFRVDVLQKVLALLAEQTSEACVVAARCIALFADSLRLRSEIVKLGGVDAIVRKVLNRENSVDTLRVWTEIAFSKLVFSREEVIAVGLDEEHKESNFSDPQSLRPIFLTRATTTTLDIASMSSVPFAISSIAVNPHVLVSFIERISGSSLCDQDNEKKMDLSLVVQNLTEIDRKILVWAFLCIELLTLDTKGAQRRSATFETRSHPYTDNENYGDWITFPGAVSLIVRFSDNVCGGVIFLLDFFFCCLFLIQV